MAFINKEKLKGINSQTAINLIALIFVNGLSFVATPIISKMVGTEGYGICSIYTTYVNIFTIICALRVGASLNTAKVKYENEFRQYCSNILLIGLFASIIFACIAIIFKDYLSKLIEIKPALIICLVIQGITSYAITFMTMMQINEKNAQRNLLLSFSLIFSTTFLSILFIKIAKGDYIGRIAGLMIPTVIIGTICSIIIFRRSKPTFNSEHWKYAIIFGVPVIFQDLSNIVLNQADKVMLQKAVGFSLAGIYSFGVTFSHITSIVYQAINKSWIPFYYEDLSRQNYKQIQDRARSSTINMTCICIGFLLVSKEFFGLYASKDYYSAISIVPILVLGCYMQYLYFYPVNHELYHSNTIYIALGTVSASIVNIILNSLLIPKWGMIGASIATAFSYIALFIFHEFIARVKYAQNYCIQGSMYFFSLLSVSVAYGVYYLFFDVMIIRWIIAASIGIALIVKIKKNKGLF